MKRLLNISIITTLFLFSWGAAVRSMGAGLACPDWPLCHGSMLPPRELLIWMEWGHRLIASSVGFMVLGIAIWSSLSTQWRASISRLAWLSVLLVLLQSTLGGIVVLLHLEPYLVSAHLGLGLVFLSVLLWMRLRLAASQFVTSQRDLLFRIALGATMLVYAQSLLGGYVASSHAGLACPDFPTCFGLWLPPLEGLVAIQFWHRIGALAVLMSMIALLWIAARAHVSVALKRLFTVAGIVTAVQILLGIGNVVFELPLALRVAHLLCGTLLYSLLFAAAYGVRHARISESH